MRVLVTGIKGFVAAHLVPLLLKHKCEIVGTGRGPALPDWEGVRILPCDLTDSEAIRRTVKEAHPAVVFHLAAVTSAQDLERQVTGVHTNVSGTIALLDAIRSAGIDPLIIITGSSAEYGFVKPDENPINEDQPTRPVTEYARSKCEQSVVADQYVKDFGQRIVRTRAFNHLGPGQRETFVPAAFARQLIEIERRRQPPVIRVGNLESVRDFTDVRDVVRAYWLLVMCGVPGEIYNVCSSTGACGNELLQELMALSGLRPKVEFRPADPTHADVPMQVGSYAKLKALTGWEPLISRQQSLADMLTDWRERLPR